MKGVAINGFLGYPQIQIYALSANHQNGKKRGMSSTNDIGNANENRCIKELEKDGWMCYKARRFVILTQHGPRSARVDHFSAFDVIAAKDEYIRFIQVGAPTDESHKKAKIRKNFPFWFHHKYISIEIWIYTKEGRFWQHNDLIMVPGVRGRIKETWVRKENLLAKNAMSA